MPMDAKSEAYLLHVHPALVRIMQATAQTPVGFEICYGIRTLEAERAAVASGHSQSLHSRHLPQYRYRNTANLDGLSCAVDVAHLALGKINWAPGHEEAVFGAIAAQVKRAAASMRIPIEWGGDAVGAWAPGVISHFRDWGHFQLPWTEYP